MKADAVDVVDTAALAELLRDAVGRFVRAIRSRSPTTTTARSEVLAHLERHGPTSIAAVAQARGVRHQSMRLVVAGLQELGLLALLPDPADGRSYRVSLTAAGRAAVKSARKARSTALARSLAMKCSAAELALLNRAVPLIDRLSEPD